MAYESRWPAFKLTLADTGQEITLIPRDGDIARLEELKGTSAPKMDWGAWSTRLALVWLIGRREKQPWASDTLDEFYDVVGRVDDAEELDADPVVAEGKALALDPPTG